MGSPEETGQPPWSASAASAPGADQPMDASASVPRAPSEPVGWWGLSNDDVAALEHDILDPDVSGIGGDVFGEIRRRRAEGGAWHRDGKDDQTLRREQDQVWLDAVRADGFTGPLFEIYWDELARYGIAVMMSWTHSGKIFKECRKRGRPIRYPAGGVTWGDDERRSIINETVAKALTYLLDAVLRCGKWTAEGGASLRTFLVGACLLQFPNVFNGWAQRDERETRHRADLAVEDAEVSTSQNVCWGDPVGSTVAETDEQQRILAAIPDPLTRQLVELVVFGGIPQNVAAEKLGITAGAAWGRLDRYRRRAGQERNRR